MSASCPNCGSLGQRDWVGRRDRPLLVRLCPNCNLVFEGMPPTYWRSPHDPDEFSGDVTVSADAFRKLGDLHAELGGSRP